MTTPPTQQDPRSKHTDQEFPSQQQEQPGLTEDTQPEPDHGETTYPVGNRLEGKRVLITGGDSGIGRAVAIAFAREGADTALSYLPEEQSDAQQTIELVQLAGRRAVPLPGDIRDEAHCVKMVGTAVEQLGGLDVLVLNAAYQKNRPTFEELTTEEFMRVFTTNLFAPIWIGQTAVPHLAPGSSIIVTTSIQAFQPSPDLIDYAMTKAALVAFVKALAQELGSRGIRVNGVAPGPIWTPLIPATGWSSKLTSFGQDTPLGRAGQPAEVAGAYVYLASEAASYVSGAILPVTGGKGL